MTTLLTLFATLLPKLGFLSTPDMFIILFVLAVPVIGVIVLVQMRKKNTDVRNRQTLLLGDILAELRKLNAK